MKILVTGGAGFIGSHIADGLIEQGHDVVIIDDLSMGNMDNVNPDAKFYLMDIRSKEVAKMFELEKFDIICHQAAQMDIRKSVQDPVYDAGINILGTINLLQNCVDHKVKKVLFSSTGGAVYGEQETFPCSEDHPLRPISPYGIGKLAVEKYLYYYANEFQLNYTILRYANVYGPRQNPKGEAGVIAIFAEKLLKGEQPLIHGDGKQTRDYIYVEDIKQANLAVLEDPENHIYNVGTGIETDVNQLFEELNQLTGSQSTEKHGPAMPGEQRRSVINPEKLMQKTHWKPDTDLQKGLEQTVQFFRSKQH